MIIDTDYIVELCLGYKEVSDNLGIMEPLVDLEMKTTISEELSSKFGEKIIYYASSSFAVAGLDDKADISGIAIEDVPCIVGKSPELGSIVYKSKGLYEKGLLPSLVFETIEPRVVASNIGQGVAQLFPYAALPLTELHYIEAIGIDVSNYNPPEQS